MLRAFYRKRLKSSKVFIYKIFKTQNKCVLKKIKNSWLQTIYYAVWRQVFRESDRFKTSWGDENQ